MGKSVSSFQFKSGDPVNSEFTERLEAVRSQTAKNSPGLRHVGLKIKQTPQGWTGLVDPSFIRSIREIHAFQVVPMQVSDVWGVKVRFGTVNNEVPEIGGVELDQELDDAPFLPVNVSSDGQRFIYLRLELNSSTYIIDELDILEAASVPSDGTLVAHRQLNIVNVSNERISSVGTAQVKTALGYAYAGALNHIWWRF